MPDPFAVVREQMVARQLQSRGVRDLRVLTAMRRVPRHLFVDPDDSDAAYSDRALGIACEQTISQPYIVALMTEALDLCGGERVLELGTGSGYQAAVLAELGAEVFTLERHAALAWQAQQRLSELDYAQIHVRHGDGHQGWADFAPFDRIVITAACAEVPPALPGQLRDGGLLVAPIGPSDTQVLTRYRRQGGQLLSAFLIDCRFVPLLPGLAREPA